MAVNYISMADETDFDRVLDLIRKEADGTAKPEDLGNLPGGAEIHASYTEKQEDPDAYRANMEKMAVNYNAQGVNTVFRQKDLARHIVDLAEENDEVTLVRILPSEDEMAHLKEMRHIRVNHGGDAHGCGDCTDYFEGPLYKIFYRAESDRSEGLS